MRTGMSYAESGRLGAIASAVSNKRQREERIRIYFENPSRCKICRGTLEYNKRKNKFCSHSCAAKNSNSGRKIEFPKYRRVYTECIKKQCQECFIIYDTKYDGKFCSHRCGSIWHNRQIWENKCKRLEQGENLTSGCCKRYLIDKFGTACRKCGWNEINPVTNKVPTELEHIDGNSNNNTIENVTILCPNCHALTPTYKALNKGKGRFKRRERYKSNKSF